LGLFIYFLIINIYFIDVRVAKYDKKLDE